MWLLAEQCKFARLNRDQERLVFLACQGLTDEEIAWVHQRAVTEVRDSLRAAVRRLIRANRHLIKGEIDTAKDLLRCLANRFMPNDEEAPRSREGAQYPLRARAYGTRAEDLAPAGVADALLVLARAQGPAVASAA